MIKFMNAKNSLINEIIKKNEIKKSLTLIKKVFISMIILKIFILNLTL